MIQKVFWSKASFAYFFKNDMRIMGEKKMILQINVI